MAMDSKKTSGSKNKSTPDLFQVARQSGFPLQAFVFVQRGLDATVCGIHGEAAEDREVSVGDVSRHVSGAQLCCGLRDYAIAQYGLLARTVLHRWHIRHCEDFGHIVFAMVEAGVMHKTDNDTVEDFAGVFDFNSAFAESLTLTSKI